MALKPCKECKKEVSTSAKVCPHCGVQNPTVTASDALRGLVFLVVIIGGCVAFSGGGDKDKVAKSAPPKVSDAECVNTLACWGERHLAGASVRCTPHIEKLAKFSHKWTDSLLEMKMSHYRWRNQAEGTVTYIGDKIQFQNGFGAWQNYVYECDYDPKVESPIAVRAEPGRL